MPLALIHAANPGTDGKEVCQLAERHCGVFSPAVQRTLHAKIFGAYRLYGPTGRFFRDGRAIAL